MQTSYTHAGQVFVPLGRPAKAGEWRRAPSGSIYEAVRACEGHGAGLLCEALAPVPFQPGVGQLTGWRYGIRNGELDRHLPRKGDAWLNDNGGVTIAQADYSPGWPDRPFYIMERDEPDKPRLTRETTPEAQRILKAMDESAAKAPPQPDYEALLRKILEWMMGVKFVTRSDGGAFSSLAELRAEIQAALYRPSPPPAPKPCSHEHCVEISNLDRSKVQRKCETCGIELESAHGTGRRRADWAKHTVVGGYYGHISQGTAKPDNRTRTDDRRSDDKTRQSIFNGHSILPHGDGNLPFAEMFRDGYRAGMERGKGEGK